MLSHSATHRPRPGLALVALLALLAFLASPGSAQASDPARTLGVYAGSGAPGGVADFEQRLGRPVDYIHDYLDKRSWTMISSPDWMTDAWRSSGRDDQMVISVPMLPDTGGTLEQGAAGAYDHHFERLAGALVAGGQGSAVLRLGWEFNGTWYRWSIAHPGGGAAFAEYWRQIVRTMRAVPGANFTFDWCPASGSSWVNGQLVNPETAWPGDGYVDYIGLDQYDQGWGPNYTDPAARWETAQSQPYGMRWHRDFAAAHGKPMTFPEWGLADRTDGHGGGDAPYFIEQMHRWITANNVAYHLYFEFADADVSSQLFGGKFPLAAERFVSLFGATAGGAAPTLAPKPEPASDPALQPAPTTVLEPSMEPSRPAKKETQGPRHPAKLEVARSTVDSSGRQLNVLAPITKRASGTAEVVLEGAAHRKRFAVKVNAGDGRLRFDRPIPARQARMGTGILTISYPGNDRSRPQEVRLRAASRRAGLDTERPRYADGRLRAKGRISSMARGMIRVQLDWVTGRKARSVELQVRIRHGRWSLDKKLGAEIRRSIAAREGTLHSYTLFTGYLRADMQGEMRSYQVLGER